MEVISSGPIWVGVLLVLTEWGMFIGMTILWLRTMARCVDACHPVARHIQSNQIWLTFIPLFGFIWQFFAVARTADSLAKEYSRRNWSFEEDRPGMETGVVTGVVVCLFFFTYVFFGHYIHPAIVFVMLVGICFCMYRHKGRLEAYLERLEKEPDAAISLGQIPLGFGVNQWNQPAAFPGQWQQQYPPVQQNYPPPPTYHPPPQNPFLPPQQQPVIPQQQNPFLQPPQPTIQPAQPNPFLPPPQQNVPPAQPNPFLPPQQQNPFLQPQQQNYPPTPNPFAPPVVPPQQNPDDDISRWMPKNPPPPQP
jgi:hypothetical protein